MIIWYNFKIKKPTIGVEVIAYNHKWIDEDFNPMGQRVGFLSENGFISAYWWDYQDTYMSISKMECESSPDFYANHIDNTEPEYWTEIPKFSDTRCEDKCMEEVEVWIARDEDSDLNAFESKPEKNIVNGTWNNSIYTCDSAIIEIPEELFPDIKWADKEPTSAKIILNK